MPVFFFGLVKVDFTNSAAQLEFFDFEFFFKVFDLSVEHDVSKGLFLRSDF